MIVDGTCELFILEDTIHEMHMVRKIHSVSDWRKFPLYERHTD